MYFDVFLLKEFCCILLMCVFISYISISMLLLASLFRQKNKQTKNEDKYIARETTRYQ